MSQEIHQGQWAVHFSEARKAAGIGREKLASKLGVSSGTIRNWETGDSLPELPSIFAACAFFGWDEDEALGWVRSDHRARMEAMGRLPASRDLQQARAA